MISTFSLLLTLSAAANEPPAQAIVVDVYDGDTLTLSTGDKVRLRGVNTPELRPPEEYGIEAREAAKELVLQREVVLGYGSVLRDGYDRLPASVTTLEGEDLTLHLLELGMGHIFVIPPSEQDMTLMIRAQETARQANRGIWSTERYSGDLHITSFHANANGDDNTNVNGEYLRVCNIANRPVDLQGYTIRDISGRSWTLPALIIPVGHTVKIHSGVGEHQTDPVEQLAVYLGSSRPIWNNSRDRATIYNRYGQVVDSRHHEPSSRPRN